MSIHRIILAAVLLPLASLSAAPVVTADFDAVATGPVDGAALTAATTGGTWSLNTTRGATYEIQDSAGDKALLLDDPDLTGNNNAIQFAGLFLSDSHPLADGDMTWTFRTAARRTGTNKGLRFEFLDLSGNSVAATVDWYSGGAVNLNGVGGGGTSDFTFLHPWNPTSPAVRDVSVTFSGTTVSLTFGAVSLTGTIQNGVTDIRRLRIYSINSAVDAKGLFLDDLTVTQNTDMIPPKITSFVPAGSGVWELTLAGTPGKTFEFRSSTTLTFNPGALVENLTQGNPGTDPGSIGGANNSRVTTDGGGNAKVRFVLSGSPSDFVRAVEVP